MTKIVLFVLGSSAIPLARLLKQGLDAEVHAPVGTIGADVFYEKASPYLASLFRDGRTIVGLCASGILIRSLAAELKTKLKDPPVLAVSEDGSSVVPLLGGHHGANELAHHIAAITGGHAAVTTASEISLGYSLDMPAPGFVLSNIQHMKSATQALLNGAAIAISGSHSPFPDSDIPAWSDGFSGVTLHSTEKQTIGGVRQLIYHPKTLVMGLGCERHTAPDELIALANSVMEAHGLSPHSLAAIASIDLKEDEPAIHAVANFFGLTATFFSVEQLAAEVPRLATPSDAVTREVGIPGVAEAAALAAAGDKSILLVPKTRSERATCAIAKAPDPLLTTPGRPRGQLQVVGIGPGAPSWRSPAAVEALRNASEWVGYDLYLDLIADLRNLQHEHRFPLGDEEVRVRHAVQLASNGLNVALVCSGDAGIYAMAALVFEILELDPSRIGVTVIPGISAFQAASARAGALIGHDFCCISLSDLLTPWEVIEARIQAAASGDLVVAFYNPRSLKRRDQLERAIMLLKSWRQPHTPVIIASNLGRANESIRIVRLDEFDPGEIDMLTIVMVGASQSRVVKRGDGQTFAYTPRGYARKRKTTE